MVLPEVKFNRENFRCMFLALLHMKCSNSSSRAIVRFCKCTFNFTQDGGVLDGDVKIYLNMNLPAQTELKN